jgi:hypothetical protein
MTFWSIEDLVIATVVENVENEHEMLGFDN